MLYICSVLKQNDMKYILLLFTLLLVNSCSMFKIDEFPDSIPLILTILAGFYEVIVRLIPTSKVLSIIGKLLELLTWTSQLLDRKK